MISIDVRNVDDAHLVVLDTEEADWAQVGWTDRCRVWGLGDRSDREPFRSEYIRLAKALIAVPEIAAKILVTREREAAASSASKIRREADEAAHLAAWEAATDGLDPESALELCEKAHGKGTGTPDTKTPGQVILYRGSAVDYDIYQYQSGGWVMTHRNRPDMGGAGYGMNT